MSEDDFEEALWDYKSLRKSKVPYTHVGTQNEKGSMAEQKGRQKSKLGKKSSKKNKGDCEGLKASQNLLTCNVTKEDIETETKNEPSQVSDAVQTPRNARPVLDGHCPICQMPFSILLVQTPRWHVSECLETQVFSEIECPDGLQCNSSIPSHYRRYTHFILAKRRSWGESESSSETNLEFIENGFCITVSGGSVEDPYQQGSQSPLHSGGKQNALLRSGAEQYAGKDDLPKDDSKQTHFSTLVKLGTKRAQESSLFNSTQKDNCHCESKILPFQNMEVGETVELGCTKFTNNPSLEKINYSYEEISYSPLCSEDELTVDRDRNPRKKLNFGRDSEEENTDCESILSSFVKLEPSQEERDHGCSVTSKVRFKKEDLTTDETFHISLTDGCTAAHKYESKTTRLTKSSFPVVHNKVKQEPDEFHLITGHSEPGVVEVPGPAAGYLSPLISNRVSQTHFPDVSEEDDSPELFSKTTVSEKLVSCAVRKQKATCNSTYSSCSQSYSQTLTSAHLYSDSQKESKSSSISAANTSYDLYHSSQMVSTISSHNSLPTKPSTSKGFKQMDIGVFFGLKPKVVKDQDNQITLKQQSTTHKDDSAKLKSKRGYSKQTKRKADEFVEDAKTRSNGVSVKECETETANGQHRGKKRFKEEGAAADKKSYSAKNKQCPFYKKIPGTPFVVDAFQYGEIPDCTAYFLTHFHSDHYIGLKKNFRCPVYCSRVTGNLVKSRLRVEEQFVKTLPMDTECIVDGIKVVLLDANHCPGAVLLLFVLPNGTTILHTGDFRANQAMEQYPSLQQQKISTLYLDTTYCSPEYTFPSQDEAIQFAVNIAFETVALNPRTLVVCGTYAIGKEKVFLAIAGVLGCKASMFLDKYNTLRCLESQTVNSLITTDWNSSALHVLPMMRINFKHLQAHLSSFSNKYDQVLAFKPTGWTYSGKSDSLADIKPQVRGRITIYGVPYSEHSSYLEMKRFVQWLKPNKIIPTVNMGSWESRKTMESYFREWKDEATKKMVLS